MNKALLGLRHIFFFSLLIISLVDGLEYYSKYQRQNTNTDFLLHEAAAVPTGQTKRDYVASVPLSGNIGNTPSVNQQQQSSAQKDYDSQFPSLGSTHTTSRPTGKRDYVAPNHSSRTTPGPGGNKNRPENHNSDSEFLPSSSKTTISTTPTTTRPTGKRDYVAPPRRNIDNTPSPKRNQPSSSTTNFDAQFPPLGGQNTPKPNAKRDYVAPKYPTATPSTSKINSNVKDLINFYDNKNKDQNSTPTGSSYSSILQNSNKNKQNVLPNLSTTKFDNPVTEALSTSGSNKPGSATSIVPVNTSTKRSPTTPLRTSPRPSTPLLPSSLAANNQNQGNNGNLVGDNEIKTLSEELLRKDVNNAAKYVTVNYQEKTTASSKDDKASQPLLTVAAEAWNIPTITKFVPLLDNYERDTLVNEHVTPQERNEENAFMDAIMSTTVIRHLMNFLKEKGYVSPDPRQQRDFLKQLWFSLYSRGKGKISSSGFEHIFVSELKNGEVSGLHNWIYFSKEESANRVNYLGYLKYLQLNDKGVVMKLHFNQLGVDKPVDTMFIGTSPELEIALYTLCFVTRADSDCHLKLGNKDPLGLLVKSRTVTLRVVHKRPKAALCVGLELCYAALSAITNATSKAVIIDCGSNVLLV